jgi:hypothetical protein
MTDTHIHIHLNGEAASAVSAATSSSSPRKKSAAKPSPPKKPRAVSAYHKAVGAEMKKLKKAGFRGNVMKAAHKAAKKKTKKGKGKK